jgi:DNA-directed RNA polymerase subunit RPC12/RpoP
MILKRHQLDQLSATDITEARVLYLCPNCGTLTEIMAGPSMLQIQNIHCQECMSKVEILLVEMGE